MMRNVNVNREFLDDGERKVKMMVKMLDVKIIGMVRMSVTERTVQ